VFLRLIFKTIVTILTAGRMYRQTRHWYTAKVRVRVRVRICSRPGVCIVTDFFYTHGRPCV